jgi:SAM-dependent methyltransferase
VTDDYHLLARYYDAENADTTADLEVYAALAADCDGPVLDVGCGTGRVAFHLAQAGIEVVGVDRSEAMLARARQKRDALGLSEAQVELQQADVRDLDLGRRFGLIVFAYGGFMHLLTPADQRAALRCLAKHLMEDGRLVMDLHNPIPAFVGAEDDTLMLERTFTDPDTGEQVMQQSASSLDRVSQCMRVVWIYDRLASDGALRRLVAPAQLRFTFAPEMALLLEASGMSLRHLYGNYDLDPYAEDSPRMLVVAAVA